MIVSLFGSFLVTYAGVYLSHRFSLKLEHDSDTTNKNEIFVSSLELIFSELDLNNKTMHNLLEGFEKMPKDPILLRDGYEFLQSTASNLRSNVFYDVIASGGMHEITKHAEIFNAIQHAYYNLQLTLNGLVISTEVFKSYEGIHTIPQPLIDQALDITRKEKTKIDNSIKYIEKALILVSEELDKSQISFSRF